MITKKIDFSKLIGNHHRLEIKMMVLDWMLNTGKQHRQSFGRFNVIGISQALFNYSANEYDCEYSLPKINNLDWYFDAIFGRAVYLPENKALKEWRKKESIYPGKFRMLKFNDEIPNNNHSFLTWLIRDIQDFEGTLLKKEFAHPDYKGRTEPKIISVSIHTTGNGWVVKYEFSFKEFDYEPGWTNGYHQNKNESIWAFLTRAYNEIGKSLVK